MPPRPHDLVWVNDPAALQVRGEALGETPGRIPDWFRLWPCQGGHAPVVVRRERTRDADLLPVGLRGRLRHQRLAAYLERWDAGRIVRPEDLISRRLTAMQSDEQHAVELSSALHGIAAAMDATGLAWGPTGGLGFALATGLPVLHSGSDLDLVLRAASPLSGRQALALARVLERAERNIDLQIDTGVGGFSFKEWMACGQPRNGEHRPARNGGDRARRILLKTAEGPLLVSDPWAASHAAQGRPGNARCAVVRGGEPRRPAMAARQTA